MPLQEIQEAHLKSAAQEDNQWSDLLFFFYASARHEAAQALWKQGYLQNSEDKLSYAVLYAQEAIPPLDFEEVARYRHPWLSFAAVLSLLARQEMTLALRLAKACLLETPDPFLLNLIARFNAGQEAWSIAEALVEQSLRIAPEQADIRLLQQQIRLRHPIPLIKPCTTIFPQTVSFYIPAYNVERYIAGAIEGLLHQSYPLEEIIIVDDASEDDSIAIAQDYPVRILSHQENSGLAAARNTALSASQSTFLGSIDTDAIPHSRYTQQALLEYLPASDRLALVGGRLVEAHQEDLEDRWRALHLSQDHGERRFNIAPPLQDTAESKRVYLENSPIVFGANTLVRRESLIQIGAYDQKYRNNAEDANLCFRMRMAKLEYAFTPHALAMHQRRDTHASLIKTVWAYDFHYLEGNGFYAGSQTFPKLIDYRVGLATKHLSKNQEADFQRADTLTLEASLGCFLLDIAHLVQLRSINEAEAAWIQQQLFEAYANDLEGAAAQSLQCVKKSFSSQLITQPPQELDIAEKTVHEIRIALEAYAQLCSHVFAPYAC